MLMFTAAMKDETLLDPEIRRPNLQLIDEDEWKTTRDPACWIKKVGGTLEETIRPYSGLCQAAPQ